MLSTLPILAEINAIGAVIGLVALVVGLAIAVLVYLAIAIPMSKAIKSLPESARKCNPVFPWLIIIPLAGIVFIIICFLQIPASFAAHFGEDDAETKSAKTLGIVACVLLGCSIIPFLGILAAIGYLVVLCLFLRKITAITKRVTQVA